MRLRLLTTAACMTLACGNLAHAEILQLTAVLNGASSVPATDSAASGKAHFSYDTETHQLESNVTFDDINGNATAVHVHGPALLTQNGSVVIAFPIAESPISAQKTLTDAQASDLLAGKDYIDVHSSKYPAGEIRGQIRR